MSNCEVVTFPCGILGQVWCLIVSIPDLCPLSYFDKKIGKEVFKDLVIIGIEVILKELGNGY